MPFGGDLFIKGGTYTGEGNVPIVFEAAPMVAHSYEGEAVLR